MSKPSRRPTRSISTITKCAAPAPSASRSPRISSCGRDAAIFAKAYLNTAEFGHGTYGAEAAAERFFHKPAARLTRADAAVLAAVLPNPEHFSAAAPSRYVQQRREWILGQMQALGGPEMLQEIDAYPTKRR